ncbi:MAG: MFS transporter [Sphingobium sp.]
MNAGADLNYPALKRARYAQLVLVIIALFTSMDVHIGKLLIEPMKHELGLSDAQAGFINVTAGSLAYALFAVPAGLLADRGNRVRLLILAVVMWCVGLFFVGLSPSLRVLTLGKFILGVAQAVTYTSALSLFSDYFAPDRRATAMASYPVGQTLGSSGAVLFGGLGLSALTALSANDPGALHGVTPWRVVSLLFGIASLLILPLLLAIREPHRMEVANKAARGSFGDLWQHRAALVPLYLGMMCLSGLANGVTVWAVPALMRLYDQKPGDFALWLSPLALIVGIAGMTLGGQLVQSAMKRERREAVLLPAALAALIGTVGNFMALMPGVMGFAALMAIGNLSYAVAISIPVIAISFRIPNELRGFAMGIYVVLFALVGGFAAPLVGAVSTALGGDMMLGRAIALVGLPFSLGAATCFWIASRPRAPRAPLNPQVSGE